MPPGVREGILDLAPSSLHKRLVQSRVASPLAMVLGRRLLHCFGDSHVLVLNDVGKLLSRTWLTVDVAQGGTALGLANPNSRSAALPKFLRVIRTLPASRPLLFMMGEVDCGYLIWHRAERLDLDVDDQLQASFESYTNFLESLRNQGRDTIVVAAIPPPTILDGQTWGEVAIARSNARIEVTASLVDRTMLTCRYNAMLREWTAAKGYLYLDYESEILDEETGLVRNRLRHQDGADHHLDPAQFAPIVATLLRRSGFE